MIFAFGLVSLEHRLILWYPSLPEAPSEVNFVDMPTHAMFTSAELSFHSVLMRIHFLLDSKRFMFLPPTSLVLIVSISAETDRRSVVDATSRHPRARAHRPRVPLPFLVSNGNSTLQRSRGEMSLQGEPYARLQRPTTRLTTRVSFPLKLVGYVTKFAPVCARQFDF